MVVQRPRAGNVEVQNPRTHRFRNNRLFLLTMASLGEHRDVSVTWRPDSYDGPALVFHLFPAYRLWQARCTSDLSCQRSFQGGECETFARAAHIADVLGLHWLRTARARA
jgi:hypothetical protein